MTHLVQIQAQLFTSGLFQNPSFSGRILKLSLDFCHVNYTVSIFQCIRDPDTFCVNAVIKAYSCSSLPHQAVEFYFEMLQNGLFPNGYTYSPLISACAKTECLGLGQKCHGQAVKNGVDSVLPVQNSLVNMYACCGVIEVATKVFVEMPVRDLVSWNSIVNAFVKFGDLHVAHCLFDAMLYKNVVSWNVMLVGYLNGGNPGSGLKLFRKMACMGIRGNDTTMVTVLTACGRSARWREGRSVHGFIIRTLVNLSLIIDTALIDMYSKCKRADVGRIVFDRMPIKNLVCWNAMILGHCIHGNPEDGLSLYSKMVSKTRPEVRKVDFDEGVEPDGQLLPDEITFVGVLCASARQGLLTEGRNYFGQMTDVFDIKPNFAHYWCMANLFASVGLMQEAVELLGNMPVDMEMSSESSLLAGLLGSCRFKGDVMLGERIAKALIEENPGNELSHAFLLNIYAVAGCWEDVARMKDLIKERGVRRVPGCSLADLKEIVHNLKVGEQWKQEIKEQLVN
ncbi:hypothetical protein RJ640_022135 [Escallonia rubra]|uniref:Pentatricopeptide repeat-containing protein n=1 Tax=Escallonia rubra TaxID=112253 RepID=A0AA88U7N2_9ASTE|nr:hypothetical protein RJ640_022135 [Escallonia rubra]